MTALPRVTRKLFGSAASASDFVQFGSDVTGFPLYTKDRAILQAGSAYPLGWNAATISGDKLPPLEEQNGLNYLDSADIVYLYQEGISEYDAATEYQQFSIVKKPGTGQIYCSLITPNIGNPLTDAAKWRFSFDFANPSVGVPIGSVIEWPWSALPIEPGYIWADGAAISRTFPLFALWGTYYGVGDGSTTFNVEDKRGLVTRGLDNGRGLDPGRVLGSYQADCFQGHHHNLYCIDQALIGNGGGARWQSQQIGFFPQGANVKEAVTDGVNGVPRIGPETRVKSISSNYIIKAF